MLKPANYDELIKKKTVEKNIGPAKECRVLPYDRVKQITRFLDRVPHEDEIEHPTVQDMVNGSQGYEVVHVEDPPHWTEIDDPAPGHHWMKMVRGQDEFNTFYMEVPDKLAGIAHDFTKEYMQIWLDFTHENGLLYRHIREEYLNVRKSCRYVWERIKKTCRWIKKTIVPSSGSSKN